MSSLHQYFSSLPTEINRSTWEKIIRRALYLIEHRPPDTLEKLNDDWKIKWFDFFFRTFSKEKATWGNLFLFFSEHIERSPSRPPLRSRPGRNPPFTTPISRKPSTNLSRVLFWGTAITAGGVAIFLWHQSQSIDPTKFISLGDFLAQLYR